MQPITIRDDDPLVGVQKLPPRAESRIILQQRKTQLQSLVLTYSQCSAQTSDVKKVWWLALYEYHAKVLHHLRGKWYLI